MNARVLGCGFFALALLGGLAWVLWRFAHVLHLMG